MTTLRQFETEAKPTKWISPNGRLIALTLTGVRWDRMPVWLVERLQAYAAKRDWGDECTDAWQILRRVNPQVTWHGAWGTMSLPSGSEVFVSLPIHWERHTDVDAAAKALGLSYAFCPDGRFAFAERAAIWKERL